jgi:putative mRNA 3-end processing factor
VQARSFDWLQNDARGLLCVPGSFHIDPARPVERAVVTHGHADHARPGNRAVLATPETLAIMNARYGESHAGSTQPLIYGETLRLGEVSVRLLPAGHILGSAQVLLEYRGERAVISGDYKRAADPTCAPFEVIACDLFVTEATFGLPVFRHPDPAAEVGKLLRSLALFPDAAHLIGVYSLGKCQRLIALLREVGYDAPLYLHGALVALTRLYEELGTNLGNLIPLSPDAKKTVAGSIVLCPPGALADRWSRGFPERITGLASGWMLIRQRAKQRRVELPLVISDHADWPELTETIRETGAGTIWVTHGQEDALVHHARSRGLDAAPLSLQGRGEEDTQ